MNGNDIFRGTAHIRKEYIEEAEFAPFSKEAFERDTQLTKRHMLRRPILIAAMFVLMTALLGCAVVVGLRSVKLSGQPGQQQVLTLAGIRGSVNFEAAQEWYEFGREYDPQKAIFQEVANHIPEFGEEYAFYNLYSWELKDKLDQIITKYALKPVGKQVNAVSAKSLLAYLGIEDILIPGGEVTLTSKNAKYYENGYFQLEGKLYLAETSYEPLVVYRYSPKDCFDDTICTLNDTGDWEEWNYTTQSGQELLVLRSQSDWRTWVFCDRDDAMISLRLETIWMENTDANGFPEVLETPLSRAQLETLLNAIDFDAKPQPGDPALLNGFPTGGQTVNGYTLQVKSAVTDGRMARIILGLIAPEGMDLCKENYAYSVGFGNFGGTVGNLIPKEGAKSWSAKGESLAAREDNDGRANTLEIVYTVYRVPEKDDPDVVFAPGSSWRLYIENIFGERSEYANGATIEPLFQVEGVWDLSITFDEDSDVRAIEFVDTPVTCLGMVGNAEEQEVTILSCQLRTLGASFEFADFMHADFADYQKGASSYVVLKDGSKICIAGVSYEEGNIWIPLDEVDHIELYNGVKLYPKG